MTFSDHCTDCPALLPIDQTVFRAAGNRGVRCERCELIAAGKEEVERLRAQRAQQEERKTCR